MAIDLINLGSSADDGTGDTLRAAGSKINSMMTELYGLAGTVPSFRGALVYRSADQTGANYSSGGNVPWTTEAYDTDSIHDNSTNNSRLTVPSGVSKARLLCAVTLLNVTGGTTIFASINKNGGGFPGQPVAAPYGTATAPRFSLASAVVEVTPGDYFEVSFSCSPDTSIDVFSGQSWFAMEIIE